MGWAEDSRKIVLKRKSLKRTAYGQFATQCPGKGFSEIIEGNKENVNVSVWPLILGMKHGTSGKCDDEKDTERHMTDLEMNPDQGVCF